ncbi:oligosaccharide biosynthesis protein Alg14 like protein [Aspergillus karnatakaensis]|uniref:glycosyltransferase family protein n=1 Tax=Aspergillus karnatakaensis TaxID=1810916 RepID=UPI003CCC973C
MMELSQLPLSGLLAWLSFCAVLGLVIAIIILRALAVSQNTPVPKWRLPRSPIHLLVVLGSGGHTAEMLSMLRRMRLDPMKYTYRTYVVSYGDHFSAAKAVEFESNLTGHGAGPASYCIVTVPRARHVHQSYLTAPFSTLQSFWSCLLVLRGLHPDQHQNELPRQLPTPYPDLILTNGPATAVCVILAAKLLRGWHYCLSILFPARKHSHQRSMIGAGADRKASPSQDVRLRTIFVESWARVKTLSLSGKILLPFADRFLVQWPALGGKRAWPGMRKTEYVGALVD